MSIQNKESHQSHDHHNNKVAEIHEIEIDIINVSFEGGVSDSFSSSSIIQIHGNHQNPNNYFDDHHHVFMLIKTLILPVLEKVHAGYFRISLGLCSQALLWKTLSEPSNDFHPFRLFFQFLPFTAFILLWSLALFTLVSLSFLYILHCFFHYELAKNEFLHHVGVNYLFAPWISWLLLLQSTPFFKKPGSSYYYLVLCWLFIVPILALDIKIYGEWFTKGKRVLSWMANPTTQISAIGNLVAAGAAAKMGWIETAICMFSLGMIHYLVLFVTLYQRLPGSSTIPAMLRPVFFSFISAPSIASLAWDSINGKFDTSSKMLFFISLFLFISLISRPGLFKKAMKKFSVAWWAYSFPLTSIAIASTKYAQEVKTASAHLLMLFLSALSVLVSLALMVVTALNGTSTGISVLPKQEVEEDHNNNTKKNRAITAETLCIKT